jgi:hypothetical protein
MTFERRVTLDQLLRNFTFTLTFAEIQKHVGKKRLFRKEEAGNIINEINADRNKDPSSFIVPDDTDNDRIVRKYVKRIAISPEQEKEIIDQIISPKKRCQAISKTHLRKTCGNILNKSNKNDYCPDCWYPSIISDYAMYKDLRDQGFGRIEAAEQIGLPFVEEAEHNRRIVKAVNVA